MTVLEQMMQLLLMLLTLLLLLQILKIIRTQQSRALERKYNFLRWVRSFEKF